jgi:hypothetical protein
MKSRIVAILLIFVPTFVGAQGHHASGLFELQGSVSFNNSILSSERSPIGTGGEFLKTQTLALTPSCGYFLTSEIECLVDLRYAFTFTQYSDPRTHFGTIRHHALGLSVGVAYNYQVNEFFTPFVGAKIGISWDRDPLDDELDTGWGNRALIFPDLILGGRLFVTKEWAVLLFGEYVKTAPMPSWEKNESLVLGIGFSVFI